jgi:phosphatidylglycerophosphate synthase
MTSHLEAATAGQTLAETVQQLRSHGKPARGAPGYSRYVNRPLGRLLAAIAYRAGLTPNVVTAISAGFSAAGIAAIAGLPVSTSTGVVAALLLAMGYGLDSADGQLARLQGVGSARGEWLDHVVDCVKINALHLGVALAAWRGGLDTIWVMAALAWVLVGNLFFCSYLLTDLLRRLQQAKSVTPAAEQSAAEPAPVLRALMTMPTDYGVLCVAFLLWGVPTAFFSAYVVLLAGTAAYLVLGLPRWFRSLAPAEEAQGGHGH